MNWNTDDLVLVVGNGENLQSLTPEPTLMLVLMLLVLLLPMLLMLLL